MNYNFCTYFDVNYLSRGLALYASLRIHCPHFRLWVLCMDSASFEALQHLRLPGIQAIRLDAFEAGDHQLLGAKKNRSQVEYYFTCTPSLPLYILRKFPEVEMITYLDADLYFFYDPAPLFEEMGDQSIAIIGHRFPAAHRCMEQYGIYNVGWLSFRRDEHAVACLQWWRMKCIEWCYDRVDNDRYADQKYLDVWPEKFQKVVVLQHHGANLAPWNLANYNLRMDQKKVFLGPYPLIFFHFHGLKKLGGDSYDFSLAKFGAHSNEILSREIFSPYIRVLNEAYQIASHWQNGVSSAASIRFRKAKIIPEDQLRTNLRANGSCMSGHRPEVASPLNPFGRSSLSNQIDRPNEIDDSNTVSRNFQQLSRIRRKLAEFWLTSSEKELPKLYAGNAGQLQREIIAGPLKNYPLLNGEFQKVGVFIKSIEKSQPGVSDVRGLLAAMLYLQPYELPGIQVISLLPEWFQQDYLCFLLELPRRCQSEGVVDAWSGHLERVTDQIHEGICRDPYADLWQKVAHVFAEKAMLIPFYFIRKDLKRIFSLRASIVEFASRHPHYSFNPSFPNADRVGVAAAAKPQDMKLQCGTANIPQRSGYDQIGSPEE